MYLSFDAPSGEACLARREVSNTPLQALTLLNDDVFVEAAQTLGREIDSSSGSTDDKVVDLFRRCTSRLPSNDEQAAIARFYQNQKTRLAAGELDAAAIAGEKSTDDRVIERAAWTLVARAVLNLDEVITKE
jgi:hypothetical protein